MATEDGFQPDRPPIFLSGHAEEAAQPDIGKGLDIATISSRILKTSILAVAVTAIGIAILSVGNPVVLVANVTDWWVDKPALQREADPATSTIQTIAGTQDSPTTTMDAPPRDEIAAAVEPAEPSQPRPPVRGRPRAVSARPRTASQSLPTTSRSLKNCSSNSRPGQPKKRRGNRPGPRKLRPYGWRKMARRRRGPRRSTDGFTPCKMHARRSVPSDIAQGSGSNNKMHGNRSRP